MESNRHSIKTVIKHTEKRHHHQHHHHRRTNKIRQKIELKKQHFQCVINLNTTLCGNEGHQKLDTKICTKYGNNRESHKVTSVVREPISFKSQCYTRIAPYCFREKCRGMVKPCRCQIRERRDRIKDTRAKHYYNSRKHRWDTRDGKRGSRFPDRQRKNKNDTLKLSPISSSPLKDELNHLYEDISNDSLDKVMETPMSYKNIIYVEDEVESKLDTLIKRTKERERKQVAQSRIQPSYSFSSISNMSSGECPMDLGSLDSISLRSRSTLVLEKSQSDFIYLSSESQDSQSPQSEFSISPRKYQLGQLHSPPQQNYFNMNIAKKYEYDQFNSPGLPSKNNNFEHDQTYSHISPQQNNFSMNIPNKYEHDQFNSPGLPSKNAFNVNILKNYEHDQTYSPPSPKQNDFSMNISKKYEHDQFNSPRLPSNNDFNMKFPKNYEHDQTYSPISPQQNDFFMNIPNKFEHDQSNSPRLPSKKDFNMNIPKNERDCKIDNIKVEPMDTRIYSPTFEYSKEIKKETFEDVMEMLNIDIKKEV